MSLSDNPSVLGVIPHGVPGVPTLAFYISSLTSATPHVLTVPSNVAYIITHFDVNELSPTANDNITAYISNGTTNAYVMGATVGTGHVGPFNQSWDGPLFLPNGWTLNFVSGTSSGSFWSVTGFGYFIPIVQFRPLTGSS
jgi:hypothetical protein